MIVESRDDLRSVYEAVRGRKPLFDGAFDVHRIDGALALVMEPCAPAVVEGRGWFTARAFPVDPVDLPPWREGEVDEPRLFPLRNYGAYFNGKCVASLPLPAYPVAGVVIVQTGQRDGEEGDLRRAEFLLEPARRWSEAMDGASGEPVAQGKFDVHLAEGALVYAKEPCAQEDTEARFFLHIRPERVGDLPEERRGSGFDNLDFDFFPTGVLFDGKCAARIALPDYPIASARTGQYMESGGELWRAEFAFNAEPYRAAYEAAVSGEPLARSAFDVHVADGALVYAKEPCEQADTAAKVFLHIVPERVDDLPEARRGSGFDNLDFEFFLYGALFEGKCAARVPLPDYPIASIRTGQHAGGAGEIWSAEFAVER